MNKTIFSALLLTSFFNQSFATEIKKVEVYPPYVSIGCSNTTFDSAGKIGLALSKISTTESTEKIFLTIEQQLKVCNVAKDENGANKLSWTDANPFKGFEVQIYDDKTNSLKTRKEIIDTQNKFNKFEVTAYSEDLSFVAKRNLTESANGSTNVLLEINKKDFLDQNDFDLLDSGKAVKKIIVLSTLINTTSSVGTFSTTIGDQKFSGRNIALILVKEKNNYKVKSISLK